MGPPATLQAGPCLIGRMPASQEGGIAWLGEEGKEKADTAVGSHGRLLSSGKMS